MAPLKLTRDGDWQLADGLLDLKRRRWLGIREINGIDQLVSADLDATQQEPELQHQPADFAGYGCLSADGTQLAWVEWQQAAMPWQSSELWCADLSPSGELSEARAIAGGEGVSVFQPQWLPNGSLLVAEDSDGWWNLKRRRPGSTTWEHPWPMTAETAMPQWIYGMSTTAWDGEQLLATTCADGCWSLQRLSLDGTVTHIDQPFDDLAGLRALNGRAVAVASNSSSMAGLLELTLSPMAPCSWTHTPALETPIGLADISVAETDLVRRSCRSTHPRLVLPAPGRTTNSGTAVGEKPQRSDGHGPPWPQPGDSVLDQPRLGRGGRETMAGPPVLAGPTGNG